MTLMDEKVKFKECHSGSIWNKFFMQALLGGSSLIAMPSEPSDLIELDEL